MALQIYEYSNQNPNILNPPLYLQSKQGLTVQTKIMVGRAEIKILKTMKDIILRERIRDEDTDEP